MSNALLYWKVLKGVQQASSQVDEIHCEAEDEKTLKYDALFNIEYWYPRFTKYTFPTEFVSISVDEATAMMERYQKLIHGKPQSETNYSTILENLASRIDEHTKKLNIEYGFFVRLSSRSPKDASFADSKMKTLLQQKLSSISKRDDPEVIQNAEFIAFFESQIESLKIQSGKEALELLCSSERVFVDLQRAFSLQSMSGTWNINIVLRKWVKFHISEEFRTFIYNRNLTALSQYFDMLFFPKLAQRSFKFSILERIQQFVENVRDELPYDNCVMDLAVTESGIYCIEFNGWFRFTSPCLFNWKADLDTFQGLKPLEFRTVKKALPVLRDSSCDNTLTLVTEDPFGMLQEVDNDLVEQKQDVMKLLQDFMEDDLERINSNLRYILNKRTYLSKQTQSEI